MMSADRIGNELDSFSAGQSLEFDRPVSGAIVDGLMQPSFFKEGMFAAARRSEDGGADMACDVDGRQSHPATGVVDEDGLIRLQTAHDHQQLPGSKVVYGNGHGLFVRKRSRLLKDTPFG